MAKLDVHLCPETGICSIIKEDGKKVDLMPDEAATLRAAYDADGLKKVLAEADATFAEGLASDELEQIAAVMR